MKNFIFKSQGLIKNSSIQQRLYLMNNNILYITHELDKCNKMLKSLTVNKDLQEQVDKYFDVETSPQTDSDEQ